jgi:hypothetical protein
VSEVKPELRRVGNSQSPVVVIDDFSGALDGILAVAESLAPYPPHTNYYPGVRRVISAADSAANAYVQQICERAAAFIAGAFDVDGFTLLEASFSMVTTDPSVLSPPQRAPHFDSTDQKYLAVLHYLRVPPETGTGFYRQRSTGIERITDANVDTFVRTARRESAAPAATSGYIQGSDAHFEQIGAVDGIADRLIIYHGSLLHSGLIPPDMDRSADPREGRLTANIFVRAH